MFYLINNISHIKVRENKLWIKLDIQSDRILHPVTKKSTKRHITSMLTSIGSGRNEADALVALIARFNPVASIRSDDKGSPGVVSLRHRFRALHHVPPLGLYVTPLLACRHGLGPFHRHRF